MFTARIFHEVPHTDNAQSFALPQSGTSCVGITIARNFMRTVHPLSHQFSGSAAIRHIKTETQYTDCQGSKRDFSFAHHGKAKVRTLRHKILLALESQTRRVLEGFLSGAVASKPREPLGGSTSCRP